jgi:IS30 family transposase
MGTDTIIAQKSGFVKPKLKHHLTEFDRIQIEILLIAKHKNREIAALIGCSERTIRREKVKGTFLRMNTDLTRTLEYSADIGQQKHIEKGKNKGRYHKINDFVELRTYLEKKFLEENFSPELALESAKKEKILGALDISVKTLYNSIDAGEMRVSRRDLLRRIRKKKSKLENKGKIAGNNRKGLSIEKRPEEVNSRQEFGHWEIDLVVGKQGSKQCLLTLIERTRGKKL